MIFYIKKIGNCREKKWSDGDFEHVRGRWCILNNLVRLFGLKMQLEKTQAIVFGEISQDNYKLCEDINLKWNQSIE